MWLIVIIVTIGFGSIFFSVFAQPKKGVLPSAAGTGEAPPQQPYQRPLQHPPQSYQPSAQTRENDRQGPMSPWSATLKGLQQSLGLGSSTVNIGRSSQNQLRLNDPLASKVHAQIWSQGQNHIVVDLGSVNGTFVNEQKLLPNTPHLLKAGDRVRFGQTVFIYTRM